MSPLSLCSIFHPWGSVGFLTKATFLLLFLLFLTALVPPSQALTCDSCEPSKCNSNLNCPHGKVLDSCKCCFECAKGEDEECGGKFNLRGKCSTGLDCFIAPKKGDPLSGMEVGVCAGGRPLCVFCGCLVCMFFLFLLCDLRVSSLCFFKIFCVCCIFLY